MNRIGHYAVEIIATILSWAVISVWVPMPFDIRIAMSIALVVVVLVIFKAMRKHNYGWCGNCVTPLNPNKAVTRHARSLRMVHLHKDHKSLVFAYVVAGILITGGVLVTNVMPVIALWSMFQLTLIYVVRANVLHTRLQPWCPKCHERGKDVKIDEPLPVDGLYV